MNSLQDQTVYLAGIYTAAYQVNKLARTGEIDEDVFECLINSLLTIAPRNAIDLYGGNEYLLKDGYRMMVDILNKAPDIQTDTVRYVFMLLMLERKISARNDMQQIIGDRLSLLETKVKHFSILSDNVIDACGQLYEDTVSKCGHRIMVLGEPHFLQRKGTPEKIRTLLLAGIRAAMQWQFSGGRRWRLFLLRKQTMAPALERLEQINRRL